MARLLVVGFASALSARTHEVSDVSEATQLLALSHSIWRTRDVPVIGRWDCTGVSGEWKTKPMHLQVGSAGDGVAQFLPLVNFTTGEYGNIDTGEGFAFRAKDFNLNGVEVVAVNACGINPNDSILYCVAFVGTGDEQTYYLVQIDETQMRFVGRLPGRSFAAAFSADGDFYALSKDKLYTFRADDLAADLNKPPDTDLTCESLALLPGDACPFDIVVLNVGEAKCAVGVSPNLDKLLVVDIATKEQAWLEVEVKTFNGEVIAPKPQGKFGAAWNFENQAFFSGNTGQGVFSLELDGVNLSQVPATGTATLTLVGGSGETKTRGDGFNCLNGTLGWSVPEPVQQPVLQQPVLKQPVLPVQKAVQQLSGEPCK